MSAPENPATASERGPQLAAHVSVDATRRTPLARIWRYVGYDEPNYTYTTNGHELLGKLGAMADGPYFIRCHFILCSGDGTGRPKWGSTNVYTEDAAGNPVYTWDIIDRILDTIIERGCLPFIEIGFMPEALTTAPPGTQYDHIREGGWRYPPRDYQKWQGLITALGAHCLERYGMRQLNRWYWELWNEPDIFYWEGTVEEYCRMYDHTEAGLHAVLPQAYLGGPGVTGPGRQAAAEFLHDFLAHCVSGTNTVDGETGTRLDFVSFHAKGGGYRPDPDAAKQTPAMFTLVNHVAVGLDTLATFPELAGLEVNLSECDPDGWAAGSKRDNRNLTFRNTEYYASWVARSVCQLIDLRADGPNQVDGMLTWAFQFEDREYFAGLRTLSTNGIDKPVLGVFRLLARLGGARLALSSDRARDALAQAGGDDATMPPEVSGIATIDQAGVMRAFLSSHHDDWDVSDATVVTLEVAGLVESGRYNYRRFVVDQQHANSYTAWVAMGEPPQPSKRQLAELHEASLLRAVEEGTVTADIDGGAKVGFALMSHAACLVELTPT